MKALIDKLASGNAVYETPDAEISENRIAVELEQGESTYGEIAINGKHGMSVKVLFFPLTITLNLRTTSLMGLTIRLNMLYPLKICMRDR